MRYKCHSNKGRYCRNDRYPRCPFTQYKRTQTSNQCKVQQLNYRNFTTETTNVHTNRFENTGGNNLVRDYSQPWENDTERYTVTINNISCEGESE